MRVGKCIGKIIGMYREICVAIIELPLISIMSVEWLHKIIDGLHTLNHQFVKMQHN